MRRYLKDCYLIDLFTVHVPMCVSYGKYIILPEFDITYYPPENVIYTIPVSNIIIITVMNFFRMTAFAP